MHMGALLDEFKRLDAELPDGLQMLLDELQGPDGLATRRDQIVHAIWLWAEDGTVRGANLRKSIFRGNGPESPPFGVDEINAVTEGLDRVSERLGAWVFLKVVTEPRTEGV